MGVSGAHSAVRGLLVSYHSAVLLVPRWHCESVGVTLALWLSRLVWQERSHLEEGISSQPGTLLPSVVYQFNPNSVHFSGNPVRIDSDGQRPHQM